MTDTGGARGKRARWTWFVHARHPEVGCASPDIVRHLALVNSEDTPTALLPGRQKLGKGPGGTVSLRMNDETGRRFGRWPWLGEHGHLEKARGRTKCSEGTLGAEIDNRDNLHLNAGSRPRPRAARNLAAQPRASGGGDAVSKGSVFCASSPRHSGPGVTGLCFCQRPY